MKTDTPEFLKILKIALKHWSIPYDHDTNVKTVYATRKGFCHYFDIIHNIDFYYKNKATWPWLKYATVAEPLRSMYSFNESGDTIQGRKERVVALKGMIKDLQAKLNNKFARRCDATGQGMNKGYVFGDGEKYFKYKTDATKYALSLGYSSLDNAYDNGAYYYTEWTDESDYQFFKLKNGPLQKILF